jgi:hypothetical protein
MYVYRVTGPCLSYLVCIRIDWTEKCHFRFDVGLL